MLRDYHCHRKVWMLGLFTCLCSPTYAQSPTAILPPPPDYSVPVTPQSAQVPVGSGTGAIRLPPPSTGAMSPDPQAGPVFVYPDSGQSAVAPVQAISQEVLPTPPPHVPSTASENAFTPEYAMEAPVTAVTGPAWYHYPWVWFPRDGWDSSVEFGLNGADGNTNSLSYVAGADVARKTDIYNLMLNLDYRKTRANGISTQDNARGNLDFDRALANSNFAGFIKSGLEYDQFKAFDARVNVDGGLSYLWAKSDQFSFITRFGAGAAKEIGSIDDAWKPEALFGLESTNQVDKRHRLFAKIDYFPAWEDFSDYRLVTDAGWEILLNDTENFSLKLSATNRYDSTPLGLKPRDVDYAATLLYKF